MNIVAVLYQDKNFKRKILRSRPIKLLLIIFACVQILIPPYFGQTAIFENDFSDNNGWISEFLSDIFHNSSYNTEFGANRTNNREVTYLDIPRSVQGNSEFSQFGNDTIKDNNYTIADSSCNAPNDQTFANESFEDLLKSQAEILDSLEELVKSPATCTQISLITDISNPDDNNELTWTWKKPGLSIKPVQVQYINPLRAEADLSIEFAANNLTVYLATNATKAITTTADDIKAAVSDDPYIAALFEVQDAPGNNGSNEVTSMNATALTSGDCNGQEFVTSFENLMRRQTTLYASFENLLYSDNKTGWNESMDTRMERAELLNNYGSLVRKEAFLLLSFESILKTGNFWDHLEPGEQMRLLDGFGALLNKQIQFHKSLNKLDKKLDMDLVPSDYSLSMEQWSAAKKDFLRSYDDLMRLEVNLNGSFQDLLKLTDWIGPAIPKILHGSPIIDPK
jgi:hypothetical protein